MLIIDGKEWGESVIVNAITEHFSVETDGAEAKTQSGKNYYGVIGTRYNHTVTAVKNPELPSSEWESFCKMLAAPVESHLVTMPHEEGEITYQAHIFSGQRILEKIVNGVNVWASEITFELAAVEIQREAE